MKLDPPAMAQRGKPAPYFKVGSQVRVTTISGVEHHGEVVGFDRETKFLWLKRPMVGQHERSEVTFVNMNLMSSLDSMDDYDITPEPLPFSPIHRMKSRLQSNVIEFRKQKSYIGENVSPEGQHLMDTIAKTITDVKWEGDAIVVMDCVMITPPYTVVQTRLVSGKENTQNMTTLAHIRKMVEKHQQDERSRQAHGQNNTPRHSTSPSPAPSSSSTSSAS